MRMPTLPSFTQIWQSIGGAFHDPEERKRRALEQAEQLRRAVLYESLVQHPGWAIYQEELGELMQMAEQAILNRLPLPAESAPAPEWLMLQETAIRGQVQGYRIALTHVTEAIAAAHEMVERSPSADGRETDDSARQPTGGEGDG